MIRKNLAAQLGYLLPPVKVNDNISLSPREYTILLKGVEITRYELPTGHELAIPTGASDPVVEGRPTKEPAFGLAALWVPTDRVELARSRGYTMVDAVSVLGTHLTELIRRHASELFTRQDAKGFCDRVAQTNPKVVEDLVPKMLSLSAVQRVLQNLLRERVPIRDSVTILEALGEASQMTKNSVLLTEYARQAVRRVIVKPCLKNSTELSAFFLEPSTEQAIEGAVEHGEHNSVLGLAPQTVRDIVSRIRSRVESADPATVIITNSAARYFLKQILDPVLPQTTVLSHSEVPPEVKVRSLGTIG
jgi:flagellar biosynthesis protein FlhA